MQANDASAPATPLAIPGELTIYTAAQWHASLVAALSGGQPLCLDLSGVTELDTAGVQLLLTARREGTARGLPVRLTGAGPAVCEVLALLGLGDALEPGEEAHV